MELREVRYDASKQWQAGCPMTKVMGASEPHNNRGIYPWPVGCTRQRPPLAKGAASITVKLV